MQRPRGGTCVMRLHNPASRSNSMQVIQAGPFRVQRQQLYQSQQVTISTNNQRSTVRKQELNEVLVTLGNGMKRKPKWHKIAYEGDDDVLTTKTSIPLDLNLAEGIDVDGKNIQLTLNLKLCKKHKDKRKSRFTFLKKLSPKRIISKLKSRFKINRAEKSFNSMQRVLMTMVSSLNEIRSALVDIKFGQDAFINSCSKSSELELVTATIKSNLPVVGVRATRKGKINAELLVRELTIPEGSVKGKSRSESQLYEVLKMPPLFKTLSKTLAPCKKFPPEADEVKEDDLSDEVLNAVKNTPQRYEPSAPPLTSSEESSGKSGEDQESFRVSGDDQESSGKSEDDQQSSEKEFEIEEKNY